MTQIFSSARDRLVLLSILVGVAMFSLVGVASADAPAWETSAQTEAGGLAAKVGTYLGYGMAVVLAFVLFRLIKKGVRAAAG